MRQTFPKLRQLEAIPYTEDGRDMVLIRDPLLVSESSIGATPQIQAVLSVMDGAHSVEQIQTEAFKMSGLWFSIGQIEGLIRQLDEAYFLENDTFHSRLHEVREAFRTEKKRVAAFAGASYPGDPLELMDFLSSFYLADSGAGLPGPQHGGFVRAIAVPHIDLRLGGSVYSHAYRALGESPSADLYVILGICHQGLRDLFSVCWKDFETPLGTAHLDQEFAESFRKALPNPSLFDEVLAHRTEHTIEFQIPFLQHLFPRRDLSILPVLTSFGYDQMSAESGDRERLDSFVHALQEAENETGRRVTYVASVDLAHIGPRYGDFTSPTQSIVDTVTSRDKEMLETVVRSDPEGFLRFIEEERDQRRICGFSALYTLLNLLSGKPGVLLRHGHCSMDSSKSFVTYASLVWRNS